MIMDEMAGVSVQDMENVGLSDVEREALRDDASEESTGEDLDILARLAGEDKEEHEDEEATGLQPLVYQAPPVENFTEKMTALDAEDDEAVQKFKAADLEFEELLAKQREIEGRRAELRTQQTKADISAEQAKQVALAAWGREVNGFMRRVKSGEGIDYAGNKPLNVMLDTAVRDLAADPKNSNRPGRWFLETAHKQVRETVGLRSTKQQRAFPVDASVDEDDAHSSVDLADLDSLTGLDLEEAVAQMSPEEQDRWARSE